ncbi:MAG TPA: succinyl-diaminopimelate desuccinylase [Actinocrinis sp.]|nr:succinyl-diaminopimelate desuccinylase [Actinocrinis sp.]
MPGFGFARSEPDPAPAAAAVPGAPAGSGFGPAFPPLDLTADAVALTVALVDFPSVSGEEKPLADAIEAALRALPRLEVVRDGEVVIARTDFGQAERAVLAGHIDTVPIADNVPSHFVDDPEHGRLLYGCGTSDMKSGVAVQLRIAGLVGAADGPTPNRDLTFVFYDCEEIEAVRNGLGRIVREQPQLLAGDLAVLFEPTDGLVEGGCQGSIRIRLTLPGRRSHAARSWLGQNAIHRAGAVLAVLNDYQARQVEVDGLTYREGLNAVAVKGGVASNVIPDECEVIVAFRFAPDRTEEQAVAHLREVFAEVLAGEGVGFELADSSPAARPGLDLPLAADFVAAVGLPPRAKYGWTDVARFAGLGVPAVNFGPGDPNLAHTREEHVSPQAILDAEEAVARWLKLG